MEKQLQSVPYHAPVKPFVCVSMSHEDLFEELEFLFSTVFPRINIAYECFGSTFFPNSFNVDPKHYENDKASREQLLHVYLTNIREAAPYFIGILGSSYGLHETENAVVNDNLSDWYLRNLENAARNGFEWVLAADSRYSSTLELGITEAAFRHKNDFCYFYYKESSDQLSDDKSLELVEHKDAGRKLKELKQQIIDTDLPVSYFSTLQGLADCVCRDWTKVLHTLYPPLDKRLLTPHMAGFLENELDVQFTIHSHTRYFQATISTRNILYELHKRVKHLLVTDNNEQHHSQHRGRKFLALGNHETMVVNNQIASRPIIVLTGMRGIGKTAVISQFLRELNSVILNCPVFVHFANGFSKRSDLFSFMNNVIIRMRYFYKKDKISLFEQDYLPSRAQLVSTFQHCLTYGACILVIDGIDYLQSCSVDTQMEAKGTDWLPEILPSQTRIILTTTKTDLSFKYLKCRHDVSFLDLTGNLSCDQVSNLTSKLVTSSNTAVVGDQVKRLNGVYNSGNPLFVLAVANVIGGWCLGLNIEKLLPTVYDPSCIGVVWRHIIELWTLRAGWCLPSSTSNKEKSIKKSTGEAQFISVKSLSFNGWVADVLRLIAVSRTGVRESELLSCLATIGYNGPYLVSSSDLKVFRSMSRFAIIENRKGFLHFSHPSLAEAVDRILLRGLTYPSHQRPVSPFKHDWENQKERFHRILGSHIRSVPDNARRFIELPWQHLMTRDALELGREITEISFFLSVNAGFPGCDLLVDFDDYVEFLKDQNSTLDDLVAEMLHQVEERLDIETRPMNESTDEGHTGLIRSLISKSPEDSLSVSEVTCLQLYAASALIKFGYGQAAESILLAACHRGYVHLQAGEQSILCRIQMILGDLLLRSGQIEAAKSCLSDAEKTITEMLTPLHMDQNHFNYLFGRILESHTLARILTEIPIDRASIIFGESTRCNTRPVSVNSYYSINQPTEFHIMYSLPPRSSSATLTQNDSKVFVILKDRLELARKYYERACCVKGKATVVHHLGILSYRCRFLDQSEACLRQALALYHDWFGSLHADLAVTMDDLAVTLAAQGSGGKAVCLAEAEEILRKGLKVTKLTCGEGSVTTARSYCHLAKVLTSKRRRDANREAKELYQKALDILITKIGFYHSETISVRKELFAIHREFPSQRQDRTTLPIVLTKKSMTKLKLLQQ